jgi:hypothetical protein
MLNNKESLMAKNTTTKAKKIITPAETEPAAISEVKEENNTPETTNSEIVEVEWAKVQPVFEFRQKLQNLEAYFSNMCLQFEKNKTNLMSQIVYGETDLYAMAQTLQKDLNVCENLTYELKLPAAAGEKGYFLRKDTQQ